MRIGDQKRYTYWQTSTLWQTYNCFALSNSKMTKIFSLKDAFLAYCALLVSFRKPSARRRCTWPGVALCRNGSVNVGVWCQVELPRPVFSSPGIAGFRIGQVYYKGSIKSNNHGRRNAQNRICGIPFCYRWWLHSPKKCTEYKSTPTLAPLPRYHPFVR